MPTNEQYKEYLDIIANPDRIQKVAKLEFLNADGTVAFTIDNNRTRGPRGFRHSKAWLQSGTLTVSLQNGQRRKASITFADLDKEFDFSVNHLWFGQQVRLSMGVKLADGTDYYLPQGVFYISSPSLDWKPNSRQMTYQLVDKWAYLDGSLFGNMDKTIEFTQGDNIFSDMTDILQLSKQTLEVTTNKQEMIDNVQPVFTDYFNSLTVTTTGSETEYMCNVPYTTQVEYGSTYAKALLTLNDFYAGWIGYDAAGALRVEPDSASDDNLSDLQKPVQWDFTTASKTFLGLTETSQMGDVYNYLVVVGEALTSDQTTLPYVIMQNDDPTSDTAVSRIGCKVQTLSGSGYYTIEQCTRLAKFKLKRMAGLQKQITITCTQMFHLQENNLITVKRTDKDGSPIEKHLIQSFSIPIAQSGTMSITATSVNDYAELTLVESGGTAQWECMTTRNKRGSI